ncbi:phosphatidate cytidylyltransferase [Malacoplasma penetrans]|uniref:Phosphatidate cytidylyltransferase n=1 Tax=Malacoplasma penetrans (strain HF-2) TaxID=272633 RepID=Q8EUH2_MALP2|nr:phosphatidate cytidylyltransferase [Malacoplasma penetrans]RXY96076.1 phosphatidate cytidylyltransferase [Malacoplasma penetrans]BAC44741.1 CDP-diglyceride synthetase [Malacoplasma penetrans HF-2]
MKMLLKNKEKSLVISDVETKPLINKLDSNKKKNLKNRTVISVFIFLYYLIILAFAFLSDKSDYPEFAWIPSLSEKITGIFAILLFFMVLIPFELAVFESLKLIFHKHEKIPIIIIMILCSIVYIIPLLVYLIAQYFTTFLMPSNQEGETVSIQKSYYLIVLSSVGSLIVLIVALNIILKIYKKDSFKNVITINVLLLVIVFGFIGFVFVALSKGWTVLLFIMISVMCTDVMCYLWGMFFGKHKMAKVISPNKTWEGAILGTITTVALLLVYCGLWQLDTKTYTVPILNWSFTRGSYVLETIISFATVNDYSSWLILCFLSVLLVIFSILGDLLFSYVKRKFDIKDFSNLLKSHGGILDRVDSLLMTSLVYFFYSLIATSTFLFSELI